MQLPLELLRSFVAVVDYDGFGRAGELLGRSQPAMSLQIKRLEEMVGAQLLLRSSRKMQVTELGKLVLHHARRMLAQHDELVSCIQSSTVSGVVRLGIPNEFAVSYLPQVLASFAARHPEVKLEVVSELSKNLLACQQSENLDLVIAISAEAAEVVAERPLHQWQEELVWVESDTGSGEGQRSQSAVALIVAPDGCVYRERMLAALDARQTGWDIVYTGTSYGGIRAAVMAGLGVTALARSTVPDGLKVVSDTRRLPGLSKVPVSLHFLSDEPTPVVGRLADFILQSVGVAAQ